MKKRLLSTFIVIVLLFSFCSVSFASTDDGNAGIGSLTAKVSKNRCKP